MIYYTEQIKKKVTNLQTLMSFSRIQKSYNEKNNAVQVTETNTYIIYKLTK